MAMHSIILEVTLKDVQIEECNFAQAISFSLRKLTFEELSFQQLSAHTFWYSSNPLTIVGSSCAILLVTLTVSFIFEEISVVLICIREDFFTFTMLHIILKFALISVSL